MHRAPSWRAGLIALVAALCAVAPELAPCAASANAGQTLYVVSSWDATNVLTPIDVATDTAGTPIPLRLTPDAIAITPDGTTAYAAYPYGLGSIVPISLANNTVGTPIPIGQYPDAIVFSPDGQTAYVAVNVEHDDGQVWAVNLVTKTATFLFETDGLGQGGMAVGLAISPDGQTLYASDTKDGVVPYDIATNTVGSAIPVPAPQTIAVTPDGRTAYVISDREVLGPTVTPVDLTNGTVGKPIPFSDGVNSFAIGPDGTTGYAAEMADPDVTPFSTATGKRETPIPAGTPGISGGIGDIVVSPNGQTAYVTNILSSTVTPIDLTTDTAEAPIAVPAGPRELAITLAPSATSVHCGHTSAEQRQRVAHGQAITLVCQVVVAHSQRAVGPSAPSGTVSISVTPTGTTLPSSSCTLPDLPYTQNKCEFQVTSSTVGTYTVTADYQGDVTYRPSSAQATLTIK